MSLTFQGKDLLRQLRDRMNFLPALNFHSMFVLSLVREVTHPQWSVAIEVAKFICWEFLEALVSVVRQDRMDAVDFNVEEMDVVGRLKVRHVGGWVVRKILTRARNYTRKNVYTNYSSTLAKVETKQRVCELLEENVIQSFDQLQETSVLQKTL